MNEQEREVLLDVFENTEAPEKIKISLDPLTRDVTIVYEDCDDEWFRELQAAQQGTQAEFPKDEPEYKPCPLCGTLLPVQDLPDTASR